MKILILGGGGFIGGHLGKYFKDRGDEVTIIDIKKHSYFKETEICDLFKLVDLRYSGKYIWPYKYDQVYQLASDVGGAGYIFSGKNDADIMANSAQINLNVAKEASWGTIGKLFFSSSSCVYPTPDGNYGLEKLFSERMYQSYQGVNLRIGRFQNVFGTHDQIGSNKERFITAICRKVAQAKDGESIEVWGDGTQRRSFIYVKDCIEDIIALMDSNITTPCNIGSERTMSVNDITELIIDISGKKLTIENIWGEAFILKYGFTCPVGAQEKQTKGIKEINLKGLEETYRWVKSTYEN